MIFLSVFRSSLTSPIGPYSWTWDSAVERQDRAGVPIDGHCRIEDFEPVLQSC